MQKDRESEESHRVRREETERAKKYRECRETEGVQRD